MPDHIHITKHLHSAGFEEALGSTFLGQAHIAGTGPEGKTCRECKLWGMRTNAGVTPPDYFIRTGELKRGKCNHPIPHKANRRVPHHAKACRFFDQSENPPAERKPE